MPRMAPQSGIALGLDHIGIVGADLDALAEAFTRAGFALTAQAAHASGRTGNRCAMLRDGGYLELIAKLPGQSSATIDGFLAKGEGAHIIALEVGDEIAARDRLRRTLKSNAIDISITERPVPPSGAQVRFALIQPPEPPEGRLLLIHHRNRDLLWRPECVVHPNRAETLIEAVYAVSHPADMMAYLSRVTGRPAEPDPLGGFSVPLERGCIRVLPKSAAYALFPRTVDGPALIGLTVVAETAATRVVHAGGVVIHLVPASG